MLTLALLLLDLFAAPGGASDRVRGVTSTVLGPAEGLVSGAGRAVSDAAAGLTGRNREQLDDLRRQNDALRLAARAAQDDQRRAQEADALLKTAGLGRYRMVAARVVAISPQQAARRMVTLDAGSRDGVKTELTVLSGQGLVGPGRPGRADHLRRAAAHRPDVLGRRAAGGQWPDRRGVRQR